MFWEEIKGADGIVRQLQWTARVEGSLGAANGNTMTLSQYLGRGATSRGRTTIGQGLNMVVSTVPYLIDQNDVAAVVQGVANLQKALSTVANLTWLSPAPGQSAADYVANVSLQFDRRVSHLIFYRHPSPGNLAAPTTGWAPAKWAPTTAEMGALP
jgi:cellobiose dehydrogenase (acceptor)